MPHTAAPSAALRLVMAAVRPARSCTTIFGTPVVPEVISTHSVRRRQRRRSRRAAAIDGAQATRTGRSSAACGRRTVVDHDRIDFGCGDHGAEMIGLDIGRQDHQAPRDAVKLDQRQRRRQLARGREQDRPAGQIREPAAES